jgi:hypothetical protein
LSVDEAVEEAALLVLVRRARVERRERPPVLM